MTPDDLRSHVANGSVHTVVVAFCDHYGRLLGKRVDAGFFCDQTVQAGTHACDYLFTVDMEMEPMAGYGFASWDQGYGDVHLVPDLSTIRPAGWAPGTVWVMCDVHRDGPVAVAPRTVLRRQVERAAAMGFDARGASELEFFVYEDSYRDAAGSGYAGLEPIGWYLEDYHLLQGARAEPYVGEVRRALAASGIPVESTKGEWGRGQHEINISYCSLLEMADRHALVKQAMKELADAQGRSVTFMAKPHADGAGSSCHVHLSLWRDGQNVFAGESDEFRWFLGGWMTHAAELMAWYAPTVNSSKRHVDESWAPTRLAWSHDNRTVGFRVVGSGASLRIECRIPGADVNPYLVHAASLAAGLDGIERRLDPPDEFVGDAYRAESLPPLPHGLAAATDAFAASPWVRATFGDDVVEHYAHAARLELAAFRAAVTDWERARYFERI